MFVEFVFICNILCLVGSIVIVGLCFGDICKFGFCDGKVVVLFVFFMVNWVRRVDCIGLEDGVFLVVNIGIDLEIEEMLVVVGIDVGIYFSFVVF